MNEEDFYAAIGAMIRERRMMADLTQADFAAVMGTTPNTISRWETGTYHPSAYDIYLITAYFRVSVRSFYDAVATTKPVRRHTKKPAAAKKSQTVGYFEAIHPKKPVARRGRGRK